MPVLLTFAAAAVLAPAAWSQTPEAIVAALVSEDAAVRKGAEPVAVQLGAPMVKPLCDLVATGEPRSISVAEKALAAVVAAANVPGADGEPMVSALAEETRSPAADRVRVLATTLLGLLPGDTSAKALGEALADPVTSEAARTALERMPFPRATRVLCEGFTSVLPPQQPAVLLSLGARRDPKALPLLLKHVRHDPDGSVFGLYYLAGIDALGMIGGPQAAARLTELATGTNPAVRERAVGALIAIADTEQPRNRKLATRCYRAAYDHAVTPAQRTAALIGLSEADGSQQVRWLLEGLGEEHCRQVALARLREVPEDKLAGPVRDRLRRAAGDERETLLQLAAERQIEVPEPTADSE
jgi:HEAT repeat protein